MPATLSPRNPKLKELRRLTSHRSARRDASLAVIEGRRALEGAIASGAQLLDVFVAEPPACSYDAEVHIVERAVLDRIANQQSPQGVLATARFANRSLDDVAASQLAVVLDGVSDPGNVGAIARTAAAFGATALIAAEASADPFGPKAIRGSAGAIFALDVVADVAALEAITALGPTSVAATPTGPTPLGELEVGGPFRLVLGGEAAGLSPEAAAAVDHNVSIPTAAAVESLNVAVAAGIVLHRQFGP